VDNNLHITLPVSVPNNATNNDTLEGFEPRMR
jgi:hypothetical protein